VKLYHINLSGHSHRARLFLSILGLDVEMIDIGKGEASREDLLALNPFGQVPVLVDGPNVVTDSNAIIVYLAKKYGRKDWLPETYAEAAAVQKWLSVAANEIANGPCAARLITVFQVPLNAHEAIGKAHKILKLVDGALADRPWIAAGTPTIADIALYSYIAHAPEGNVDISPYTHVTDWLRRFEQIDGFVALPKTAAGLVRA
jgi:glutathione S-transferase